MPSVSSRNLNLTLWPANEVMVARLVYQSVESPPKPLVPVRCDRVVVPVHRDAERP